MRRFSSYLGLIIVLVLALALRGQILFWGVQSGFAPLVGASVYLGADLEARDTEGRTPLMLSAAKGDVRVVHLLLRHGADPDATDPEGHTASWYATQNGQDGLARLLNDPSPDTSSLELPNAAPMALPPPGLAPRAFQT